MKTRPNQSGVSNSLASRLLDSSSIWFVLGITLVSGEVHGGVVNQLGEQDFLDGQTPITSSAVVDAGVGEPFPFDGTIFGDDRIAGDFGSFEYIHDFALGGLSPTSATLTIGLIDHDSFFGTPPLDTIDLFFDGIQQPDDMFLGISFASSSASVVQVPVPIALLLDGVLTVRVAATLSGEADSLPGNSLAVDFSVLNIVPEPTTISLLALGSLAWIRRSAFGITYRRKTSQDPQSSRQARPPR